MKSHRRSEDSAGPIEGFTFIEILIAVAILAIIFAAGVPVTVNFYLNYQLAAEEELLSAVLERARNLSMVNYNQSPHGVYIDTDKFIVFQGDNYETRDANQDEEFSRSKAIAISGLNELIFEVLSGRTASTTLTLTVRDFTKTININEEGRIEN